MHKLVFILVTLIGIEFAYAEQHKHIHKNDPTRSTTKHGKFKADSTLKKNMLGIKTLAIPSSSAKNAEELRDVSKKINILVNDIFKNCKLSSDADHFIHPLLANILKGAKMISNNDVENGYKIIQNAVNKYEINFY
ncbi:MAG: hypothetical protein KDD45_03480 [Bdellovibrionales bacterium]|nr:hypothetical protein [Bdellovibrionales bacterium]